MQSLTLCRCVGFAEYSLLGYTKAIIPVDSANFQFLNFTSDSVNCNVDSNKEDSDLIMQVCRLILVFAFYSASSKVCRWTSKYWA